jgi:predicted glycoside hydrolase/deacetylase ChbG (UPF0249 family)
MPRLILHADDFGLTPGINRAIAELHRAGVLSSASLMATGRAFEDAAMLALANSGLGVGCHLVFVDGAPVSRPQDIPTLLGGDGETFRPSLLDFAQAALRGLITAGDLERETQAQIEKLQFAGIDVTHIDSHKHALLFPSIAAPVLRAAERRGVLPVRYPFEPAWSSAVSGAPLLRRLQLHALDRFEPSFRTLTQSRRILGQVPDGTLGIAATGTLRRESLRATLHPLLSLSPDSVWELCCHPAFVDDALRLEHTRLIESREAELSAFLAIVPDFLRIPGAPALIHYGDLVGKGHT